MDISQLQIHKNLKIQSNNKIGNIPIIFDFSFLKYQNLFKNWFLSTGLYFENEKIIFIKKEDMEDLSFNKYIREINTDIQLTGILLNSKEEKRRYLNRVKGFLYDKINLELAQNPTIALLCMYSFFEYNRNITIVLLKSMNTIYKDGFIQESNLPKEKFFKDIVLSLTIASRLPNFDFAKRYKEIEEYLARDKTAIEYAIYYINSLYQMSMSEVNHFDLEKSIVKSVKLLSLFRSLEYVQSLQSLIVEGFNKSAPLTVLPDGTLDFDLSNFENFEKKSLDDLLSDNIINSESVHDGILSDEAKVSFGLTFKEIIDLSQLILKRVDAVNLILCGTKDQWIEAIAKEVKCQVQDAELVFSNLVAVPDKKGIYLSEAIRQTRVLRQPLISIDKLFLCPADILSLALIGYYTDFKSGDIKLKNVKSKLESTYKKINDDFELEVYNYLKSNFPGSEIRYKVEQKTIKGKDENGKYLIQLPREIDIIFLYQSRLILLECKNLNLAVTHKTQANEYQKISGTFQKKMKDNIRVIEENIDRVLHFLIGDSALVNKNIKVYGLIVLSNFSFATINQEFEYKAVSVNNVVEEIEHILNQKF